MSTDNLHRAVEAAKLLRRGIIELLHLEKVEAGEISADDAQVVQDTFDGETTLENELLEAVRAENEDTMWVTGLRAEEERLAKRRRRLEKRIDGRRGLMEQAMTIAQWPKHEMPIATLSIRKVAPSVMVDQESEIPSQFFKRPEPVLDKAGLGKTLKERHKAIEAVNAIKDEALRVARLAEIDNAMPAIPGCHLVTDRVTLAILRG